MEKKVGNGYHPEMTFSLEVYDGDTLCFSSNGKWLHPLFELEQFLSESSLEPGRLSLKDTIIGRAAAVLIIRMGIGHVYGRILSRLALDTFISHGVNPEYGELVDRITCMTEDLLSADTDIESAYLLLRARL